MGSSRSKKSTLRRAWPALVVLVILAGPPVGMLAYHSHRTGQPWSQILARMFPGAGTPESGQQDLASEALPPGEASDFLRAQPVGEPFEDPPRISHVQAVDLDRDGLLDIVACDALKHRVTWIRQHPPGAFTERASSDDLNAPAHVQAVDFDADGDLDLMVAVLGILFPNNDKIGAVVILENAGDTKFEKRVVVDRVARVSDVRADDLDGDGDMDLAVAQFGYDDGETRWIENLGQWHFRSHILQTLSGPVHCEIADIDADGDRDLVLLVSQEWEEIYLFLNGGKGDFSPRLIHGSTNHDFGSSGIFLCDLDRDGDTDVLYTNGDAFDYIPPRPRPWHGIQWLENRGSLDFRYHRIAGVPGAMNARPADVDHDGDLDLFVASAFNQWERPEAKSLLWLENDGAMRFRRHDLASTPTHILALDVGDFNADGELDLVTGGMHVYAPYDRMARVLVWTSNWPGSRRRP